MPYELKLATETRGLAAIVQAGGTLDLHGADEFDREIDRLLRRDVREILVDLRQIEFMDSIGLRSLVRAHRSRCAPACRCGSCVAARRSRRSCA